MRPESLMRDSTPYVLITDIESDELVDEPAIPLLLVQEKRKNSTTITATVIVVPLYSELFLSDCGCLIYPAANRNLCTACEASHKEILFRGSIG